MPVESSGSGSVVRVRRVPLVEGRNGVGHVQPLLRPQNGGSLF
jgi:hypothetical protein